MSKKPAASPKPMARVWAAAKPPVKVVLAKYAFKVPAVRVAPVPKFSLQINEKVQQLISVSKTNGYVTVQNINEVIPDSATDPELIENIMNILDNLDIKILDEDEVENYRANIKISMEDAGHGVLASSSYDTLNVYLSQIGYKPLLTREQEVEVSKRIEDAEWRIQESLFSCWLTLPYRGRIRGQAVTLRALILNPQIKHGFGISQV